MALWLLHFFCHPSNSSFSNDDTPCMYIWNTQPHTQIHLWRPFPFPLGGGGGTEGFQLLLLSIDHLLFHGQTECHSLHPLNPLAYFITIDTWLCFPLFLTPATKNGIFLDFPLAQHSNWNRTENQCRCWWWDTYAAMLFDRGHRSIVAWYFIFSICFFNASRSMVASTLGSIVSAVGWASPFSRERKSQATARILFVRGRERQRKWIRI